MRAGRWAVVAAMVVSMVVMAAPAGAAPDAPDACKIERPAGLWPPYFYDDYWNTYTHGGMNNDGRAPEAGRHGQGDHVVRRLPGSPGQRGHADLTDRLPPAAG